MSAAPISPIRSATPPVAASSARLGMMHRAHWLAAQLTSVHSASCLISAVVHCSVLLVLALCVLPDVNSAVMTLTVRVWDQRAAEMPWRAEPFILDTPIPDSAQRSPLTPDSIEAHALLPNLHEPQSVLAQVVSPMRAHRVLPWDRMLSPVNHVTSTPASTVGDYGSAFQLLAQHIESVASAKPVLLVWCFDESLSMKDDQQQIRYELDALYSALSSSGESQSVVSTVASYGGKYSRILRKPTADREQLRRAIDTVPVDGTGHEHMCRALRQVIRDHARLAAAQQRDFILLLVTDETGDREGNETLLEEIITTAQQSQCRVFVLGRQACFGSPVAWMRWRGEKLQIDRGPETAFVEQLPFDVFRTPHGTLNSGFAPYEHARLAQQTGGGVYLIAGDEPTLIGARTLAYDPAQLSRYQPELQARDQQRFEREQKPLRVVLTNVVRAFERPEWARHPLPLAFPAERGMFRAEVNRATKRAADFQAELAELSRQMADVVDHRANETPRWQANYDLIEAQLWGYQMLCQEYQSFLQHALERLDAKKSMAGGDLREWFIRRTATYTDSSGPAAEARRKMESVQQRHPGTPWAARAAMELEQGFSVQWADVSFRK